VELVRRLCRSYIMELLMHPIVVVTKQLDRRRCMSRFSKLSHVIWHFQNIGDFSSEMKSLPHATANLNNYKFSMLIDLPHIYTESQSMTSSCVERSEVKIPPAKPEACSCEPLKASLIFVPHNKKKGGWQLHKYNSNWSIRQSPAS
jgi:hypothetical protein